MDDATKKLIAEWLQKLAQGIEHAGNFVLEQAPLVVQEYVHWWWWSSLAGIIAGLLLCVIAFSTSKFLYRFIKVSTAPRVVILEWLSTVLK